MLASVKPFHCSPPIFPVPRIIGRCYDSVPARAKSLVYLMEKQGVPASAGGTVRTTWRGPENPDFAGKAGQVQCLHVFNLDGMFTMLQLKVIGFSCFLLLFFSFAVYAMVKMTEREHKKN